MGRWYWDAEEYLYDIAKRLYAIENQLTIVNAKLDELAQQEATVMVDLTALQVNVVDLTEKVTAQTSLDGSVAVLIRELVASQQALADQIAALQAGTVTQEQIDAFAQAVRDNATAIEAGTAQLSAAVPANVPPPTP